MLLLALALAAETVLAPGTELWVRLQTKISSNESKAGDKVEAVVIAPVLESGLVAIPAAAKLAGTVKAVKPSLKPDERAEVVIEFSTIGTSGVKPVPIQVRVAGVDNARESIDDAGKIVGILASETLAARVDQGLSKVTERNTQLGELLSVARSAVLTNKPTGEIRYDPGVELKLQLRDPLRWPAPAQPYEIGTVSNEEALEGLVNAQPFRTMAEKPAKPSDITNLMFIGTEKQLRETFEAAGWSTAHRLNAESALETVRAIAELRGYKEAPMSALLLDGKRSDFDFQKGLNTFEKRHHLRIWRRPDTFEGEPVWVCAATHDIGIEFSQQNRTFIHVIDGQIDRERAKVVTDLLFTGRVKALALVDRPEVPRKTSNATGDEVVTDGQMAVLVLE
jgi:hypothetical protein